MRYINYLIILFFILSCKNFKHKDNSSILVNARLIRTYDTSYWNDTIKRKFYDIKISLINNCDKPISFWTMTCSWQHNFIFNNDYFDFRVLCSHNWLVLKTIKSNDSLIFKTTLVRFNQYNYQDSVATKLGFILTDSINCKELNEYLSQLDDKKKHNKIFWSNTIYLNYTK